ncbi:hypothetical protein ACT89R_01865 [Rhodococcus qingshengii]
MSDVRDPTLAATLESLPPTERARFLVDTYSNSADRYVADEVTELEAELIDQGFARKTSGA